MKPLLFVILTGTLFAQIIPGPPGTEWMEVYLTGSDGKKCTIAFSWPAGLARVSTTCPYKIFYNSKDGKPK